MRGQSVRGVSAELRRLRGDPLPWVFLPVALLSALSIAASLPSDVRSAPPAVVDALGATMSASLVGGLVVLAAVLGALGTALADRSGVLARDHLFTSGVVVLGSRAVSAVASTLLFGMFGIAMIEAAFLLVTGRALLSVPEAAAAVGILAAAGLWGYLVGVLVRSPVLVLFVVPATLSPALLLSDAAPDVARILPLSALLSAAGLADGGLAAPVASLVATGWAVALAAVVVLVLRRRDRL
ncbi:hypothetical protein GCM10009651_24540 [Microbacterium natoriense]|uniref:hypothetical protein n=1 Tax=Microbacterium natoriense TaxID=284570 RepID=UPI0031DB1525